MISQEKSYYISTEFFKKIYNQEIKADNFNTDLFDCIVLYYLNRYRLKEKLDTFIVDQILLKSAIEQANYMAKIQNVTLENNPRKTTEERVKFYGGSGIAKEITFKVNIYSPNEIYTYGQILEESILKLLSNPKYSSFVKDPYNVFIGINSALDEKKRRAYVSILFAGFSLYNEGPNFKDKLTIPYSSKSFGLQPYDFKECHYLEKFKTLNDLYKYIEIKKNEVFINTSVNFLKSLLKKPEDAIAIDIIQKEQFNCNNPNILDYNLVNKGILLKPVNFDRLLSKNLITNPKEAKSRVYAKIGDIPKEITGNYELNVLIIKNKCVCKVLTLPYDEEAIIEYSKELHLLADTITFEKEYSPNSELYILTFKVPFEKGKYEYNINDIKPIFDKLKEPDFIIRKAKIEAYSSIEGSEDLNKELQQKRAQSIVNVLNEMQKTNFEIEIFTADNIDDFKKDIKKTEWSFLADLPPEQIKKYINDNSLVNQLESILQKHRYAKVTLEVLFKIDSFNEEKFVIDRFNKYIKEENYAQALRVQKYIFKNILKNKYSSDAVEKQIIPKRAETAGLLMNKLWLKMYVNKIPISPEICKEIEELYKLNPQNDYLKFNYCFCKFNFDDFTNEQNIKNLQKEIYSLYRTSIFYKTIDALNLEFYLKVISIIDSVNSLSPLIPASLDSIKSILKLTKVNWQNSLKLAQLFIQRKDYKLAIEILEPWISYPNIFGELIFTYISACTYLPYKFHSYKFFTAIKRAIELDKERLCNLYKTNKLTIQTFENPNVKKLVCETCNL